MKICIASDHRGYELKQMLIPYIQSLGYEVVNVGDQTPNPEDDAPLFTYALTSQMDPAHDLGIVLCGSGVAVSVTANRNNDIRCAIGFDKEQVKEARMHDHLNVLALAADYTDVMKAQTLVKTFLETVPVQEDKYVRRLSQMSHPQ